MDPQSSEEVQGVRYPVIIYASMNDLIKLSTEGNKLPAAALLLVMMRVQLVYSSQTFVPAYQSPSGHIYGWACQRRMRASTWGDVVDSQSRSTTGIREVAYMERAFSFVSGLGEESSATYLYTKVFTPLFVLPFT